MFNWLFKKIVTMREKVSVDLGQGDSEKPFLDHLEDLRVMITRMAITLLVVTLGTFYFYQEILAIVEYPLVSAGIRDRISLQNLKVTGGFMTAMNISLVAGVILSFPILLYFLLQFILPGLHKKEKKVIFPAIGVGAGLFLVGVLFSFYLVAPRALEFFYQFSVDMDKLSAEKGGTLPDKLIWDRVEYVKFVCQFVLIFGACFELPVVVMALVKIDVLNYKVMKTTRSWAAVIIDIAAAVITPTQDMLTLALLAVPMYVLYEICIWLAWWMEKRDRKLYPEFYKDQDKDDIDISVADDWDNENYNPWSDSDRDVDAEVKSSTEKKDEEENPTDTTMTAPKPSETDETPKPVENPEAPKDDSGDKRDTD
ncbi:MAG: hypothetical protein RL693_1076 [Verrucomicrobiota bacterium]